MKKLIALSLLSFGLASCGSVEGLSVTFKLPLPEKFGGGSIPITVEK
ncbi:hypothetical protein OAF54_01255 [bacterium]|nr:hypothetical protein [bacterium]